MTRKFPKPLHDEDGPDDSDNEWNNQSEDNTEENKDQAPENASKSEFVNEFSGDATQQYLNRIGAHRLLSAEEEVHYATLALQGNFEARQKMIEFNLRLVGSIA